MKIISYNYFCEECGKASKTLTIREYRRLLDSQKWFCDRHTTATDKKRKTSIKVSNGYILLKEDF